MFSDQSGELDDEGGNLTDEQIDALIAEAGAVIDSGSCGEDAAWCLYDNGLLVISGTGDMDWTGYYGPWYSYRDTITVVAIYRRPDPAIRCRYS